MTAWLRFLCKKYEESPDSIEVRCRITSGGGNPRESAAENIPPIYIGKGEKVW